MEDIFYTIALPLTIVSDDIHDLLVKEPLEYIGYFEEIINQKNKINSLLGNIVKLIEAIALKIDGTLKHISNIALSVLEHCINPNAQSLN